MEKDTAGARGSDREASSAGVRLSGQPGSAAPSEAAIKELSHHYRLADVAHQNCLLAITEAVGRGEAPSQIQLDAEAKAARVANDARHVFLAATTLQAPTVEKETPP